MPASGVILLGYAKIFIATEDYSSSRLKTILQAEADGSESIGKLGAAAFGSIIVTPRYMTRIFFSDDDAGGRWMRSSVFKKRGRPPIKQKVGKA